MITRSTDAVKHAVRTVDLFLHPWRIFTQPRFAQTQLRNVAYLLLGNLIKVGLGIITSALVFRALGPADAGRLTIALSIVGLLSIISEFGLRDAVVNYISQYRGAQPQAAAAVARTFFLLKMLLSGLASITGIIGAAFIAARFYPAIHIADFIQLGAVSLFADGLLAFSTVVLEAHQRFGIVSLIGALQSALRAALITLLFVGHSVNLYSLLILESIVPLVVFVYSLRRVPHDYIALHRPLFQHLTTLFHFTKWIALAALASAIFLRLDVLMLSYFRPTAEVGFYAVALALVSKLDVFKSAVLTTAFPEACRHTDPIELRAYVFQSLRLTGTATLLFLPLFVIGGWLIQWIYGVEYLAAAPALYPLLLAYLIGLNVEPTAYVLYPLNRPRWIAASDLIQLVFTLGINLILIPAFGISGAALGVLLTRILACVITFGLIRQFLWKPHDSSP
jgi:O-antigen/teichoic acid export membrane protein